MDWSTPNDTEPSGAAPGPAPAVGRTEQWMGAKDDDMPDRGGDRVALSEAQGRAAIAPGDVIGGTSLAGAMARVFVEVEGRRKLLAIGTLGGIELRTPRAAAGEAALSATGALHATGALPDSPLRTAIHAGLVDGRLGHDAGLATWVRTASLHRLLYGLTEEHQSVERLVSHYGVDLRGLLDQLAVAAVRCQTAGHPAPITIAHCRVLCQAASELAARQDALGASWTARVQDAIGRGYDGTTAIELLDLDALQTIVGLDFEDFVFGDTFMFGHPTDPAQRAVLVLLRAAATIAWDMPHSATAGPGRDAITALFDQAARIVEDGRVNVGAGSDTTRAGFLDEIGATVHLLRAVRPRSLRVGRPRFTVERAVASDLVAFLVQETDQRLLGHAAALLSVACPGLAGWRRAALLKLHRDFREDATLDAATRRALRCCRPDGLPEPARTRYLDLLSKRLDTLLDT